MQTKSLQMKRALRTALLVLLLGVVEMGKMVAQNLYYDFEQCNVGDKVAETLGDPWTTWNWNPGSAEDAIVSNTHCQSTRAMRIGHGNDVVLRFGEKTTGVYHISFDMYIPDGKEGYFNLQHVFNETQRIGGIQAFFNSEEHGTSVTGSYMIGPFEIPYDEWFNVDITVYVDDVLFNLKINDKLVSKDYFYTATSISDHYTTLAGIDFWPCSSNEDRNEFYVDNILFEEVDGPFVHNLVPENEQIDVVMLQNEIDTASLVLVNEANTMNISSWAWIDYGVGENGFGTEELHYDGDPYWTYGFYATNTYLELGINFFLYDFDSYIGMKVNGMKYFVPGSGPNGSAGCEGPMTFRLFKINNGYISEDELLAENVLNDYTPNAWNTIEFDEPIPLTGYPIFATVGFKQIDGCYPISLDAGPSHQHSADYVQLNGGGWFSLNYNSTHYGGQDYGNHNIRLICEGTPINTQWVKLSMLPSSAYFMPDETNSIDLVFNSNGLDYGKYEAVLRIPTLNDETSELSIPISLKISGTDVYEFSDNQYKVYPNPVSDMLYIEGKDFSNAIIYNALGEMVKTLKINNNTISTIDLDNGVYFIYLIDSKGEKFVQKIIISK